MKIKEKVYLVISYSGNFHEHKNVFVQTIFNNKQKAKKYSKNFNRRKLTKLNNVKSYVLEQFIWE